MDESTNRDLGRELQEGEISELDNYFEPPVRDSISPFELKVIIRWKFLWSRTVDTASSTWNVPGRLAFFASQMLWTSSPCMASRARETVAMAAMFELPTAKILDKIWERSFRAAAPMKKSPC